MAAPLTFVHCRSGKSGSDSADETVVEADSDNRERIAANGLDLHATETEGAIAFDGNDRLTARHSRADGITHTYTHHTPSPGVETLARLVHVDNVAAEVERIGPFIDAIASCFSSRIIVTQSA